MKAIDRQKESIRNYFVDSDEQRSAAEEADNSESRFLANISHEIRTPINMMINMNRMILRESENEVVREYASNALEAGEQLMFFVDRLLDFSRLQVGKEVLTEEVYETKKLFGTVCRYYEKEAEKKGILFQPELDGEIAPYLKGDDKKIVRILNHLLENALKYTEKGKVSLEVRDAGKTETEQTISFFVKDTGCGIKDGRPTGLSVFGKGEVEPGAMIDGAELGLTIAEGLASILGSHITVESDSGAGSTFSFTVIQQIAEGCSNAEENRGEVFLAPEAKILVVDDNSMNLYVIKTLLRRTMMCVDAAEGAQEAYQKCRDNRYDLILMDYMMPGEDGITALETIRKMDTPNAQIPILVLTADVSPEKRELFLRKGFNGYLTKPVAENKLEQMLQEMLPEHLVQKSEEAKEHILSEDEIRRYSEICGKYDIHFEEGLRFVSGDVFQYVRVCDYFSRKAPEGIGKLEKMMQEEKWEEAVLCFHSLKGNARNVGGMELYHLSKKLEERCRKQDLEYVRLTVPVFLMEWERVKDGLEEFGRVFREKHPENGKAEENKLKKQDVSKKLQVLQEYVEKCQQSPSLKLVKTLLAGECGEEIGKELSGIQAAIEEIEFEEAERLLISLREKKEWTE